ncbi:MAG TPA: sulfotransferase [Acidimicrobiales bacterium]|nr:sulfotransferase [Acidimicrobiales bacterium]
MGLTVVGAGLGRTGTHSLKIALEKLLGGTCYHMTELFPRPQHIALWHGAIRGEQPDWEAMLEGFTAAVDWPAAAVWDDLHRAFPDSVVLLSVRDDAAAWWRSFSETILKVMQRGPGTADDPWFAMSVDMLDKFTPSYADRDAAIAAYEAHNQAVRDSVEPRRLIEWRPADGWGPICEGLGIAVPDEPFPHVNTTDDFKAMAGL